MHTETLRKSANLPEFLQKIFRCIGQESFEALKGFFSTDFRLYFAHYTLNGITQGIGFVGCLLTSVSPSYEHVMGDIYVGDNLTYLTVC